MLVNAIAITLFVWLLAGGVFVGIGLLVQRAFGPRPRSIWDVMMDFWLGWGAAILFLQLWHLFFPVGLQAVLIITLAGLAGLFWELRKNFIPAVRWLRANKLLLGYFLIAAIIVASQAIGPPLNSDSGLYHFSAIRWAYEYPVVPGLGNLHGRLAFNSSHFLYAALFMALSEERGFHFVNGLLILVFLIQGIIGGWLLLKKSQENCGAPVFLFFLIPGALVQSWLNAASPSPDLPVFLLGGLLAASLFDLLCQKDNKQPDVANDTWRVFTILLLCCTGIVIKLSFAASAATGAALATFIWLKRHSGTGNQTANPIKWGLVYAGLLLVPWMIRGIIMSGYPFYPSAFGAFGVDWLIPKETAINETLWIRGWARQPRAEPREVLANWNWLGPWLKGLLARERWIVLIPLLVAVILGAILLWAKAMGRIKRFSWTCRLFFLLPLTGILFWFFSAPDPRFAGSNFWILAAGLLRILALYWREADRELIKKGLLALNLILIAASLCHLSWRAGGEDGGFYPIPRVPLRQYTNRWGLTLHISTKPEEVPTWDAPLPATQFEYPNLEPRHPGELRWGFRDHK